MSNKSKTPIKLPRDLKKIKTKALKNVKNDHAIYDEHTKKMYTPRQQLKMRIYDKIKMLYKINPDKFK
jgi:hypothetical protein